MRGRAAWALASAPMRRVLGAVGRVLVTVGHPAPAVRRLPALGHRDLPGPGPERPPGAVRAEPRAPRTPAPTTTTSPTATTAVGRRPDVDDHHASRRSRRRPEGDAVAGIGIPKIGRRPVRGRRRRRRRPAQGPGPLPDHASCPGQEGNTAIAGHRTTYGAPFGDLDQLATGDEIRVATVQGTFTYKVDRAAVVVDPERDRACSTRRPTRRARATTLATLTLTTCNPKYSAAERLIIQRPARAAAGRRRRSRRRTVADGTQGDDDRRAVGRVVVADPDDPLGHHRRARRAALVVALPPPPALDDVVDRRDPVPRRAVRLLHVPRAPAAVELLTAGGQDSSISAMTLPGVTG